MKKNKLKVDVQARYFTNESPYLALDKIEYIWVVAHGYAQLAEYFIKSFDVLDNRHFVIAPEGLHRFYIQGSSGRVGASWMTKLEREEDINQYIVLIDRVLQNETPKFKTNKVSPKILAFGFSQGAATISRWLCSTTQPIDILVLWAGAWPPDLIIDHNITLLRSIEIYVVIGDEDQYLGDDGIDKYLSVFKDNEIAYKLIQFNGDHRLDKYTMHTLSRLLI